MQTDIDRLFRESHRSMDEKPSMAGWEKLHQRLESRRTQSRIRQIHRISVAAVIFAVISFGIVSVLYLQYQQDLSMRLSAQAYTDRLEPLERDESREIGIYTIKNVQSLYRSLGMTIAPVE